MISPPVQTRPSRWIVAAIGAAVLAAGLALWRMTSRGESHSSLGPEFEYDVERHTHVPEKKIGFHETLRIETDLDTLRALAVGPGDRIAVAGDGRLVEFEPDGSRRRVMELAGNPSCLAIAPDGAFYLGLGDHVGVLDSAGAPTATWPSPGPEAWLTSVAVAGEEVFVADARHRTVWRYGRDGQPRGRVEAQAVGHEKPAFVVPSPYFDVAVGPDGLLRVVNPGRHRIETYFQDGTLVSAWGQASFEVEGFAGCCNPAHIAILPDGRHATSEKGLVRVKVHAADGSLECVVADATALGEDVSPREVAADSRGRILVLDPPTHSVRVFEPGKTGGFE